MPKKRKTSVHLPQDTKKQKPTEELEVSSQNLSSEPTEVNSTRVESDIEMFESEPSELKLVQEWLDQECPQEEREITEELYINKNLEGELDLGDFTKLKKVYISHFFKDLKIKDKEKYKDKIVELVNAQEWLDKNYPQDESDKTKRKSDEKNKNKSRREIKELNISKENLEGVLKLEGFVNLNKLDCSRNKLIKLDLSNCSKIVEIDCWDNQLNELKLTSLSHLLTLNAWDNNLTGLNWGEISKDSKDLTILSLSNNNFSEQDLNCFKEFKNLEGLYLGTDKKERINKGLYNKFIGSLEFLKDLTKLKKLQIEATNIDSGLEYLSESLERIVHWGVYGHEHEKNFEVKKLEEALEDYKEGEDQDYYDYKKWKGDRKKWIDKGFTPQELEHLKDCGVKVSDHNFADYLEKNKECITSYEIKKNDAQKWLNHFYPSEVREKIDKLSINNNKIKGSLTLDGKNLKNVTLKCKELKKVKLVNLSKLESFRANPCQLTEIIIENCPAIENLNVANNLLEDLNFLDKLDKNKLKVLSIHSNNFPEEKLDFLSKFKNLEELYIDNCDREKFEKEDKYNRFHGSLEPLKGLKNLKYLSISNTDIDGGLEFLPEKVRRIGCISKWKREESEKGIEFFKIRRKLEKQEKFLSDEQRKRIYEVEKNEKVPPYITTGYHVFSPHTKKNSSEENEILLSSSPALYEEWEIRGFTHKEIREWIEAGFSPYEAPLVKEWEERGFTCEEVKKWKREKGLESDDYEFTHHLKTKGYKLDNSLDNLNYCKLYNLWKNYESGQETKSSQLVKTVAEVPPKLDKLFKKVREIVNSNNLDSVSVDLDGSNENRYKLKLEKLKEIRKSVLENESSKLEEISRSEKEDDKWAWNIHEAQTDKSGEKIISKCSKAKDNFEKSQIINLEKYDKPYKEIYPKEVPGEKFSWKAKSDAIDLPTKLYNVKKYQSDKIMVEDIIEAAVEKVGLDSDIKSYAILSYVCGPYACGRHEECRKCSNYIYQGLKRGLSKATEALKFINKQKCMEFKRSIGEINEEEEIEEEIKSFSTLDYLWVDQFCIDQNNPHEKADEIHKMHQYYSNAEVTLIPIDSEVGSKELDELSRKLSDFFEERKNEKKVKNKAKNNEKIRELMKDLVDKSAVILEKVIFSEWFSRSWTFQEGWLSKKTLFMFDDALVDGRFLALIWKLKHDFSEEEQSSKDKFTWKDAIFWEGEEEKEYNGFENLWEEKFANVKSTTPIGWVYYKNSYNQRDMVYLGLNEALKEMKDRKRSVAIDGIYSILSLLPYGSKVEIEYSKNPNHQYTKNELRKALTDVMKAAINAGYAEPLTWHGPSSRMPGLCWTPHIDSGGSTSIEDYIRVDCVPERIKFKPEGMEVIGSEYTIGHVEKFNDNNNEEKKRGSKSYKLKARLEMGELEPVELIGTKEVLKVVEKGNILVVFSKGEWKSEKPFALLVTKGEDNIRHRVGLVEFSREDEKKIENRVTKRKKLIIGLDKFDSLEKKFDLENNQNQLQTQIEIFPK